jgi:hypothetical protein
VHNVPTFERDFDKDPYDKHEKQVCEYLTLIAPDIGCGTDPVGFLIASHNELRRQLQQLRVGGQADAAATDQQGLAYKCTAPSKGLWLRL